MTNNHEVAALGQFFHDIRTGRGVTLKEAAGDWSAASLSRFERGQQDLSADKAITLMARLGIENEDFYYLYQAKQRYFPLTILNYALSYHTALGSQWRKSYLTAHPQHNALTDYARVLFDAMAHWPEPTYHFTPAQNQILADRLAAMRYNPAMVTDVLKLIVGPASHELLELLRQRVEAIDEQWVMRDMYLMIIWLGALMDHDLVLADDLQQQLTPTFSQPEASVLVTQFYSNWYFGVAAARWVHQPTAANAAAVKAIIDDLLVMNNQDDAYWFRNMFRRMQHAQVHHQPLIDHPQVMLVSHTLQELIKNQRQYMGVSIEEVAVALSPTTLRRFEASKTQLGFATLTALMGELGMFPSQAFTFIQSAPGHPSGVHTLWATYTDLQDQPAKAQQIYHTFMTQLAKPEQILAMQQFILQSAAPDLAEPAQIRATAQTILQALLSAKAWYRMELLAVHAVMSWLPVDQVQALINHGKRLYEKNPPMNGYISYFFDALGEVLVQVVKNEDKPTRQNFVQGQRWLMQVAKETPGAWLAAGSWLVADAVTAPAAEKDAAVQQYLRRSAWVGHVEAIAALKREWDGVVPKGYFKSTPDPKD